MQHVMQLASQRRSKLDPSNTTRGKHDSSSKPVALIVYRVKIKDDVVVVVIVRKISLWNILTYMYLMARFTGYLIMT